MAQIESSRNPSNVRPHGGRMQLESGNWLPIEDMIENLATSPAWRTALQNAAEAVINPATEDTLEKLRLYLVARQNEKLDLIIAELRKLHVQLAMVTDSPGELAQ